MRRWRGFLDTDCVTPDIGQWRSQFNVVTSNYFPTKHFAGKNPGYYPIHCFDIHGSCRILSLRVFPSQTRLDASYCIVRNGHKSNLLTKHEMRLGIEILCRAHAGPGSRAEEVAPAEVWFETSEHCWQQ